MERASGQVPADMEEVAAATPARAGGGPAGPALDIRLASAVGNRAFGQLLAVSRAEAAATAGAAAAPPDAGELKLTDIIRIHTTVMEEYGFSRWMTDQQAAARLAELRAQARETNRAAEAAAAAEEAAHPSAATRSKAWAAERYQALSDFLAETRAGKAAKAVDESLAETSRNLGGEAFDEAFGGFQRSQQRKYGRDVEFATTAPKLGGEVGQLGYEGLKSEVQGAAFGAVIRFGPKFKLKWNKAEADAAAWMWKTEGKVTWRETEIWINKGGKLEKTARRLDAVGVDLTTGTIEALEWTTTRELAQGVKKRAQLELQRELFATARENGWRVWARVPGTTPKKGDVPDFFDITDALERTEVYPHFRKPKK